MTGRPDGAPASDPLDLARYCARCDSDQGTWTDRGPDWCAVCWDRRQPLSGPLSRRYKALVAVARAAQPFAEPFAMPPYGAVLALREALARLDGAR